MLLYLFRHGLAHDRADADCPPDAERALTHKGVERTRQAAAGLAKLGVDVRRIYTSPFRRATETADLARRAFGLKSDAVLVTDALLPEAQPAAILAELGEDDGFLVGHAPNLDLVLAHALGLASPITSLKKAGAARIERGGSGAVLAWLMTPGALRQLGKR